MLIYFSSPVIIIIFQGAEAIFRYVMQNCVLRRLHICDNNISKLEVQWDRVSVLVDLNLAVCIFYFVVHYIHNYGHSQLF